MGRSRGSEESKDKQGASLVLNESAASLLQAQERNSKRGVMKWTNDLSSVPSNRTEEKGAVSWDSQGRN